LRVLAGEGTIGAADLANQLEAARDEILRSDFEILADHFTTDLEEFSGRPLHDILVVLEGEAKRLEKEARREEGPQGAVLAMGQEVLGLPNAEQQIVASRAAIGELGSIISQNIETGAKVDVTFSGVLTEETLDTLTTLLKPKLEAALNDVVGSGAKEAVGPALAEITGVVQSSSFIDGSAPPSSSQVLSSRNNDG